MQPGRYPPPHGHPGAPGMPVPPYPMAAGMPMRPMMQPMPGRPLPPGMMPGMPPMPMMRPTMVGAYPAPYPGAAPQWPAVPGMPPAPYPGAPSPHGPAPGVSAVVAAAAPSAAVAGSGLVQVGSSIVSSGTVPKVPAASTIDGTSGMDLIEQQRLQVLQTSIRTFRLANSQTAYHKHIAEVAVAEAEAAAAAAAVANLPPPPQLVLPPAAEGESSGSVEADTAEGSGETVAAAEGEAVEEKKEVTMNIEEATDAFYQHVFQISEAVLPLTVLICNIMPDMEDDALRELLEVCGKVSRIVRPQDPTNGMKASFAFVIFLNGLSALRCQRSMDGLELPSEDMEEGGEGIALAVKASAKESAALALIEKSEKEAVEKVLPSKYADYLSQHVYAPIHAAFFEKTQPLSSKEEATSAENGGIGLMTGDPGAIAGNNGEEPVDENEKQLLSTIEQFRLRQLQRDKEVEEEKRRLIKERIAQMKQAARLKAQQATEEDANAEQQKQIQQQEKKEDAAALKAIGEKRSRAEDRELSAELEAKRRRKLQVLQLLAGEEEGEEKSGEQARPAKITLGMGGKKTSSSVLGAASGVNAAGGGFGASRPVLGGLDDDEDKPKREMVKLEYTAEELLEMEKAAVMSELQQQEDDEDLDGNLRKPKHGQPLAVGAGAAQTASADTAQGLIQAKVRAQALAIAASLQQQKQAEQKVSAPVVVAPAAGSDPKAEMKALVDQIPAEREELFNYPLQWQKLEDKQILSHTMKHWVVKKVIEYLGEEEESLTEFIISKLMDRCPAAEILEELSLVLDDDAEQFVVKLWRMLVYYSLKP